MRKKFSPLIRTTTGVLGVLGIAAIGFDIVKDGGIQPDLMLFVKLLAGFVFFYVAIFGTNPLDFSSSSENDP
jgi:hypothetical protein